MIIETNKCRSCFLSTFTTNRFLALLLNGCQHFQAMLDLIAKTSSSGWIVMSSFFLEALDFLCGFSLLDTKIATRCIRLLPYAYNGKLNAYIMQSLQGVVCTCRSRVMLWFSKQVLPHLIFNQTWNVIEVV